MNIRIKFEIVIIIYKESRTPCYGFAPAGLADLRTSGWPTHGTGLSLPSAPTGNYVNVTSAARRRCCCLPVDPMSELVAGRIS